MKISFIRIFPSIWGFCRITNFVAGGPTRGISLYVGRWQIAAELI